MTWRPKAVLAVVGVALLGLLPSCGDESPTARGTRGQLETQNAVGRSGAYYLPVGYDGEPLPLMVFFHGTGGNGALAALDLAARADAERFIVLAPDSRIAPDGRFAWEVGNSPSSRTEDYAHTLALLDELEAKPGVALDWDRALAAGHSGGGAMAPYVATNDPRFDAYAVLHGGVIRGGMGDNEVPGWFSTGEDDAYRSPDHVAGQAAYMIETIGFADVTIRVYPGGHAVSSAEKRELVAWWFEVTRF